MSVVLEKFVGGAARGDWSIGRFRDGMHAGRACRPQMGNFRIEM